MVARIVSRAEMSATGSSGSPGALWSWARPPARRAVTWRRATLIGPADRPRGRPWPWTRAPPVAMAASSTSRSSAGRGDFDQVVADPDQAVLDPDRAGGGPGRRPAGLAGQEGHDGRAEGIPLDGHGAVGQPSRRPRGEGEGRPAAGGRPGRRRRRPGPGRLLRAGARPAGRSSRPARTRAGVGGGGRVGPEPDPGPGRPPLGPDHPGRRPSGMAGRSPVGVGDDDEGPGPGVGRFKASRNPRRSGSRPDRRPGGGGLGLERGRHDRGGRRPGTGRSGSMGIGRPTQGGSAPGASPRASATIRPPPGADRHRLQVVGRLDGRGTGGRRDGRRRRRRGGDRGTRSGQARGRGGRRRRSARGARRGPRRGPGGWPGGRPRGGGRTVLVGPRGGAGPGGLARPGTPGRARRGSKRGPRSGRDRPRGVRRPTTSPPPEGRAGRRPRRGRSGRRSGWRPGSPGGRRRPGRRGCRALASRAGRAQSVATRVAGGEVGVGGAKADSSTRTRGAAPTNRNIGPGPARTLRRVSRNSAGTGQVSGFSIQKVARSAGAGPKVQSRKPSSTGPEAITPASPPSNSDASTARATPARSLAGAGPDGPTTGPRSPPAATGRGDAPGRRKEQRRIDHLGVLGPDRRPGRRRPRRRTPGPRG